jgi:predicted DNA-binding transcriptional regulator AlpA
MADAERVLTFEDLAAKGWPHTRMHTHRLVKEGKFPKPFKAHEGGRRNMWLEADVDEYLSKRARPTPQRK